MDAACQADHAAANALLGRLMGLVLALRFCCWGAGVGAVAIFLFVESTRYRGLLEYVTIPALLALYLLGTGNVLLLLRLQSPLMKGMALGGPLLTIGLLAWPGVASSAVLVSLSLGLGLWLYLGAFTAQAHALGHPRTWRWTRRLRWAVLLLLVGSAMLPHLAAPLMSVGGLVLLGATVAGWRIWLAELRLSIAAREEV